jgi:hypothetical protein
MQYCTGKIRMGMTIKEIQKGGAMNVPAAAQRQGFARALAVCYNKQTDTLTCGMSGKLRKVRIHPLIWGKSVEVLYGDARLGALAVMGKCLHGGPRVCLSPRPKQVVHASPPFVFLTNAPFVYPAWPAARDMRRVQGRQSGTAEGLHFAAL